jgi:hypothetical protein
MKHTTPITPTDESVDRLLSEFLKAQMPKPWPAAPATAASEPAELVAQRAAATETPRNAPAASRDTSARSRLTLAASVAILLGACWTLSNGFQGGSHATGTNGTPIDSNKFFADGNKTLVGEIKDKTKQPMPTPMDVDPLKQ